MQSDDICATGLEIKLVQKTDEFYFAGVPQRAYTTADWRALIASRYP